MATYRFPPLADCIRFEATLSNGSAIHLDMLLDTGAAQSTVPHWVVRYLGLPPQASTTMVSATGQQQVGTVVVPRLRALGQEVADLRVLTLTLPAGTNVDGVLGADFMRQFRLFVDWTRGVLVIQPRHSQGWMSRFTALVELIRAVV